MSDNVRPLHRTIPRDQWLREEIDHAEHYIRVHHADGDTIARAQVGRRTRDLVELRRELAYIESGSPDPGSAPNLLADVDTILADIALDNPDLEPAGMHTAISLWRTRYRGWLAMQCGHPSAGPRDGGGAA